MIKDNRDKRRQKLQLLTEWMDFFILENKDGIQRSLLEEGRVFMEQKVDKEDFLASFGLMILSNGEVDVNLQLVFKTGDDEGKSVSFTIRTRVDGSAVLYYGNPDVPNAVTYDLKMFMKYTSYQALTHMLTWIKESHDARKVSEIYENEAEDIIHESLVNYYLENRQFDALKALMQEKEKRM